MPGNAGLGDDDAVRKRAQIDRGKTPQIHERDLLRPWPDRPVAGALFVGDVEYREGTGPAGRLPFFNPLDGTRDEVRGLKAAWPGGPLGKATVLSGRAATESAVIAGAKGRDVVHLATHGFFLDGATAFSRPGSRGIGAVVRTAEKITAARARKAVEERAKGELEREQEDALRGLGEKLNVERPLDLLPRLKPIEEHEVAIATLERRRVELGELVAGVDRWAFARGLLWIALLLGAIAAAILWVFVLRR